VDHKGHGFTAMIIPAVGHYCHMYYSICDGKKGEFVNPLFGVYLNVFYKSFNEINTI
jgi:hypothetical protein